MIEGQQRLFITLYLIFLLILLAFNSFGTLLNKASAQTTTNENASLLYRNAILGISMDYPTSWKKIDQRSAGEKTFVTFAESHALFSCVVIEIVSLTLKNSTWRHPYINGGHISVTLPHYPTHKAIYRSYEPYLVPGGQIKSMDVYTLKGNRLYHIIYRSELSTFDTYLPVVEKMINSFRIINK